MIQNYLTVAWRSLRRHASFSVLNVVGLAVGLACVILIGLWVEDELSYDDVHPDPDRTYRVLREFNLPDLKSTISNTPSALAPTLRSDYPQVETAVRILVRDHTVEHADRTYVESNTLYADPGFFDLFGFDVRRGTARLDEPNTVLLTPALTDKYFPNEDPIGQSLTVNGAAMEVTGLVDAPPSNTHLDYSLVASLASRNPSPDNWGLNNWTTYVRLQPGTSAAAFEPRFEQMSRNRMSEEMRALSGDELPEDYHLQPITSIHLGLDAPDSVGSVGSITYVYLFSALALFVLLLACINFMNLATARSAQRANEVGVRKALGAGRPQLAGQFLGESLLMTAFALVLALGICAGALPAFNELAGKAIAPATLLSVPHLAALIGLGLVVGGLAGTYPAIVLSGYRPVTTLRTKSASTQGSPRLRQALVVFQFAISIALIAGTAVVHEQVTYMQSKGLGFQEENVLVVRDKTRSLQGQMDAFKQEVEEQAGVQAATSGFSVPGTFFINSMWSLDRPEAEAHNADYSYVGDDYVETLGLDVVAGRDFSRDYASDTTGVLLNEAAVQEFGFASPEAAVGEAFLSGSTRFPILGVVENFHYESLHNEIDPLLLFHEAMQPARYVAVRIAPGQTTTAIDAVRRTWTAFSELPFTYSFLANDLAAQYRAETRLESLFATFAGLAILIACLGLFGLAAYAAQQRTKEIGIRKALGATVSSIIGLLSTDFLKLVVLAFLVAAPAAYVGMQQWLQDFPYRTDLGVATFALAGAVALVVAALTVSTQAWRAARVDPARVLQSE